MTRSARALAEGQWAQAWHWNPLLPVLIFIFLALLIYSFVVVTLRLPRLRVTRLSKLEKQALRVSVVLVLSANWIYLIYQFSPHL